MRTHRYHPIRTKTLFSSNVVKNKRIPKNKNLIICQPILMSNTLIKMIYLIVLMAIKMAIPHHLTANVLFVLHIDFLFKFLSPITELTCKFDSKSFCCKKHIEIGLRCCN